MRKRKVIQVQPLDEAQDIIWRSYMSVKFANAWLFRGYTVFIPSSRFYLCIKTSANQLWRVIDAWVTKQDIKRLKAHYSKYEPTIKELKRKYETAMKEKMLISMERDKLTQKLADSRALSSSPLPSPTTPSKNAASKPDTIPGESFEQAYPKIRASASGDYIQGMHLTLGAVLRALHDLNFHYMWVQNRPKK